MSQVEYTSKTAPAAPTGLGALKWRVRGFASACVLPLMQRAARAYVGGEAFEDALSVAQRMAGEDVASTLGFWNADEVEPRRVVEDYLAAVEQIAEARLDSYLSIKPPALGFDQALATELAAAASAVDVRVHCDSHGPEVADPSFEMLRAMLDVLDPSNLSVTIPGRWLRSLDDAEWSVEQRIKVRVVKGQWPDPLDPDRDMRAGFLEVIDRLAGRAAHVAVASHDVPLAAEAISRLRAAGTSCELELLFGLPITQSADWAREHQVPLRVYIPYGAGYIPHAIDQLWRNPRFVFWILKDLVSFRSASSRRKSAL